MEMDDASWDESSLASLGTQSFVDDGETDGDDAADHKDDTEDAILLAPKFKSFREAIQSLKAVQHFLQNCVGTPEAICTACMVV